MRSYTHTYIKESFPKRPRRIYLRRRRPFELFWWEIIFAFCLIFMLLMLFVNSQNNYTYAPPQARAQDIDIGVDIIETQAAEPSNYGQYELVLLSL
jgi:hypothetical protein